MVRTVSELDVFRSAKLLVDQHGAEAPIEAALRYDAMLSKGDLDGQRIWKRVLAAINDLLAAPPRAGTLAH